MKIIKVKSISKLPKIYYPFSSLQLLEKSFPNIKVAYQYICTTHVNPDRFKRGSTKRKEWGFYAVEAPEKEKEDEFSYG